MALIKGHKNCVTDIAGLKVGHVTLYEKKDETNTVCTGVTAILPHSGNLFKEKVRAASYVVNGYGKTSGLVQVDELGLIEAPIMLTNTFAVGPVLHGTLQYMIAENAEIGDSAGTLNIVVGECNDGYLNSLRLQAVQPKHAIQAIENATNEPVVEGAIGAGKGMICYGYKGGIGTASRIVPVEAAQFTVGCLVLSNFGNREDALFADWSNIEIDTPDGSIMMIIATDAPLSERQLKRLAKRTAAGLGRTGSFIHNGSGDIAIAFSTANKYNYSPNTPFEQIDCVKDDHPAMNLFFQAVVEATEEAIINSLQNAETTIGRNGRKIEKAPF